MTPGLVLSRTVRVDILGRLSGIFIDRLVAMLVLDFGQRQLCFGSKHGGQINMKKQDAGGQMALCVLAMASLSHSSANSCPTGNDTGLPSSLH